jgi:hypothetical protein
VTCINYKDHLALAMSVINCYLLIYLTVIYKHISVVKLGNSDSKVICNSREQVGVLDGN